MPASRLGRNGGLPWRSRLVALQSERALRQCAARATRGCNLLRPSTSTARQDVREDGRAAREAPSRRRIVLLPAGQRRNRQRNAARREFPERPRDEKIELEVFIAAFLLVREQCAHIADAAASSPRVLECFSFCFPRGCFRAQRDVSELAPCRGRRSSDARLQAVAAATSAGDGHVQLWRPCGRA